MTGSLATVGPQAIPTTWNGVQFRSRMEARWAVFFDGLELEWHFEPEGFSIDGTWYLPDFWLPQLNMWIECKPSERISKDDERKIELFGWGASLSAGEPEKTGWVLPWGGEQFVVLVGPPGGRETGINYGNDSGHFLYYPGWDNYHTWVACGVCSSVGVVYSYRAGRLPCRHHEERDYGNTPRIATAARAASTVRFRA